MSSVDSTIFDLPALTDPLEDTARIPVSIGPEIDDTEYLTPLDLNTFLDGFFLPITGGTMEGDIDMAVNNILNFGYLAADDTEPISSIGLVRLPDKGRIAWRDEDDTINHFLFAASNALTYTGDTNVGTDKVSLILENVYDQGASPGITGVFSELNFKSTNSTMNPLVYATISVDAQTVTDGSEDANIALKVIEGGTEDTFLDVDGATSQVNIFKELDINSNDVVNSVLIIPTIADFTNATHDHSDVKGGAQLDNTALISGVFSSITGIGTQSQELDMGTNVISAVVDPTNAQDVATKNYVDTQSGDLTNWKQSVVRATNAAISDPPEGTESVDGANTTTGERILVKNQADATQNGIYIAGPLVWVRSVDMDEAAQFNSATVWVEVGNANFDTQWVQTFDVTDVDTDLVNFQKSSSTKVAFLGDQNNFTAENTFSGFRLTSIGDPTDEKDAVSKRYVDTQNGYAQTAGAKVASTANIDLGVTADPGNIDGISLDDGDRILLKNQTTETQNGIYLVVDNVDPQQWTRTTDYNTAVEVNESVVFVREGTLSGGKTFLQTEVLTLAPGSEDILFAEPDPIGIIGTHLTLTGPTVSVDPNTITLLGTQTQALNMGNNLINNLDNPESNSDAATKFYVDTIATALDWKAPAVAATVANTALSGLLEIDGIQLIANDRVLVKDQVLSENNGIYVAVSGTWSRSTDANTATELEHATLFVEGGNVNHGKAYTQTEVIVDLGTDPIEWMEIFQITPVIAGDGLFFTANTLNVGGTANKIVVNADDIDVGDKVVTTDNTYTYDAGLKQLFTPNSTNPGINIGSISATPSSIVDGDMWYDSTDDAFRAGRDSTTDEFIMAAGDQTISGVKTLGVSGVPGSLVFLSDTARTITLLGEPIAGNFTLTLPAITDTLVTETNAVELTNKELIEVVRENDSGVIESLVYINNAISGGIFGINRARGTESTPLALLLGDKLGGLEVAGHDGTSFGDAANIIFKATENWTTIAHGAEIIFATTANGATSTVDRLTIENDGTANFETHNIIDVGTLNTHTIPSGTDTFVLLDSAQAITNKLSMEVFRDDTDNALYLASVADNAGEGNQGVFCTEKSRGTKISPSGVLDGDALGSFRVRGYDTTNFETGGNILFSASENWGNVGHGTNIDFLTVPNTTTGATVKLTIQNDGTIDFHTNDIFDAVIDGDDNTISNIDETMQTVSVGVVGRVLTSTGVNNAPTYQSPEFVGPYTALHDVGGQTLDNVGVLISNATTPAETGAIRLGNAEQIVWRSQDGLEDGLIFEFTSVDRGRFLFPSGASYGFAETFIALNGAQLTTASNVRLNSDETHILEFQRATGSQSLPYIIGDTQWMYPDGVDVLSHYARMKGFVVNETDTTEEGKLTFEVMTGGSQNQEILEINGAGLDVNSHLISNVLDPVSAQDAATKNYVDTLPVTHFGFVEINDNSSSNANSIIVLQDVSEPVVSGKWAQTTTNIGFTLQGTFGQLLYAGPTQKFKVDMWNNINEQGGTGGMDEILTQLEINSTLQSQSSIRSSKNGGAVAKSFIVELNDGDTIHLEVTDLTANNTLEYSHMGFMLVPIGL